MTENYPEVSTPVPAWSGSTSATGQSVPAASGGGSGSASGQDTKDVAKDQAANLKSGAVEAGQNVASTAKEQASNVTAEAGKQVKDLLGQAQGELSSQAGQQQQKLAGGLHSLADELGSMANKSENKGVATDLAQQASDRSRQIASWLDDREPAHLLEDVRTFARQRPGAFLAIAAGVGLVAGRLTSGLKAASSDDTPTASASPRPAALTTTPSAYPTGATYGTASYGTAGDEYTDSTVGLGEASYGDTTLSTSRPFASSQDVAGGDYPIPATNEPAWSDERNR